MNAIIKEAIELRKQGEYAASRALLTNLLPKPEFAAKAHLQIAWSYDNESQELAAIEHYELAIDGQLSKAEIFDALFGLASTLRSVGRYEDALNYFECILVEYPEAIEIQPFYAMCLYNLGRHKEATSQLLSLIVSTTDNDSIKKYRTAIELNDRQDSRFKKHQNQG